VKGDTTSRTDIAHAVEQYITAFEHRSTIRERDSVRTHLDELITIFNHLPSDGTAGLDLIRQLRQGLPSG